MRQLQSVLNAAARLIFRLKSSDHITDALISLHWLRVPERIHCKLAVMAYKVLHGRAPSYLGPLDRVADVSGRRALRPAGTNRILVPPVTSTTVGSRAFAVAAPLIWNSLPCDVISAESLPTFQRKLKRHPFCRSFPSFCYWHLHLQWTLQWQCHLSHSKILWLIDLLMVPYRTNDGTFRPARHSAVAAAAAVAAESRVLINLTS